MTVVVDEERLDSGRRGTTVWSSVREGVGGWKCRYADGRAAIVREDADCRERTADDFDRCSRFWKVQRRGLRCFQARAERNQAGGERD